MLLQELDRALVFKTDSDSAHVGITLFGLTGSRSAVKY